MGVTGATIMVEPAMLEACVRDRLNITAPRTMVVLEPLKVVIENFPHPDNHMIEVPDFPSVSGSAVHKVALRRVIYIESSDFVEVCFLFMKIFGSIALDFINKFFVLIFQKPDKGYKRFAPGQPVGLRHAGLVLTYKKCHQEGGRVTQLDVSCELVSSSNKPKGFIHWVADPVKVEVRLYDRLYVVIKFKFTYISIEHFTTD